jgi:hypothetical protein
MGIEKKFPHKGTKKDLANIGARHLVTDKFDVNRKLVRVEYMIYEDPKQILVWKKPVDSSEYHIHIEAKIEHKYSVPVVTKPSHRHDTYTS